MHILELAALVAISVSIALLYRRSANLPALVMMALLTAYAVAQAMVWSGLLPPEQIMIVRLICATLVAIGGFLLLIWNLLDDHLLDLLPAAVGVRRGNVLILSNRRFRALGASPADGPAVTQRPEGGWRIRRADRTVSGHVGLTVVDIDELPVEQRFIPEPPDWSELLAVTGAEGVWTADGEGRITSYTGNWPWNDLLTPLSSPQSWFQGRSWPEIANELAAESGAAQQFADLFGGRCSFRDVVLQIAVAAGSDQAVAVTAHFRPGHPEPWQGVVRDISIQEGRIRTLLRERDVALAASYAKNDFLSRLSHELRTPLNAMIGFSEIMSQQMFGPLGHRNYSGYAGDIRDCGEHLLQLVTDVVDLARIESDQLDLEKSDVEVDELVESCLPLVREQAIAQGIALRKTLTTRPMLICGDRLRLRQVVINILTNAVKFTPRGGNVHVGTYYIDGQVEISIQDTGPGIPEEMLDRIFEPFTQLRQDTPAEGSGLGLAISQALVMRHGGRINVTSDTGRGTRFTIVLPVPHPVVAAQSA